MAGTSRLRPANSSPRRVFHRRRWRSGGTSRPRPCPAPRSSVSCPNSGRYGGGATLPGHCAPRSAHHRPAVPRHGSGRRSAARGAASRAGLRHEHVAGAEQIPGPVHAGDSVTRSDGRIRGDTYRAAVLRVGDSGADQVAGHPDWDSGGARERARIRVATALAGDFARKSGLAAGPGHATAMSSPPGPAARL